MSKPKYTGHALGGLRRFDAASWQRLVRAALVDATAAGGGTPEAARALGCGHSTLRRWCAEVPALTEGLRMPARGWGGNRRYL